MPRTKKGSKKSKSKKHKVDSESQYSSNDGSSQLYSPCQQQDSHQTFQRTEEYFFEDEQETNINANINANKRSSIQTRRKARGNLNVQIAKSNYNRGYTQLEDILQYFQQYQQQASKQPLQQQIDKQISQLFSSTLRCTTSPQTIRKAKQLLMQQLLKLISEVVRRHVVLRPKLHTVHLKKFVQVIAGFGQRYKGKIIRTILMEKVEGKIRHAANQTP